MSTADSLALFYSALQVSAPTFGWVVLGLLLNWLGLLSDALISAASRWAFNLGLPLLLFAGAAQVDYSVLSNSRYLLAGLLATLLVAVLGWLYSRWREHPKAVRGIFIQAAFRSNLAIVGLALAASAYGERGLLLAALPVAMMTALYNVLAVLVLNTTLDTDASPAALVAGIAGNPLIIGVVAGVILSVSPLPVPPVLEPVGAGLSAFFLPLMLLCIGGSMQFSNLRRGAWITWEATAWRLCVAPMLTVALALAMGVRGEQLGVLFLLTATPVAAASFVMVVAARGDGVLAASIIVLSTLLSVVTVTAGFFLLSVFSLVGQPV